MATIPSEMLHYQTQESLLVEENPKRIVLGLPKEAQESEKRVALKPESVKILANNGFDVVVQSGAGSCVKYTDHEYSEAGAKITDSAKDVFASDLVLKISPPTLEEIDWIKPGKTLVSAMQSSTMSIEYLEALNKRHITAIAYELIEDKVGGLPLVRAMSEIAGSTVMLIAAEYLSSTSGGKGIILGGITGVPPTKVVILGAGTVAEYAARTALGLGAEVKIFDNHIYKLRRIKERLHQPHLYTSTLDTELLSQALREADVAVGCIRPENGHLSYMVPEQIVASMQQGSVIIDVSIDSGGCFETSRLTTHHKPTYKCCEIIHYCVPNIPSRAARTATSAISNIFTPILKKIAFSGSVDKLIFDANWFAKGVYTFRGHVTHSGLAKRFSTRYKDLRLIIAAINTGLDM
jgi:alanine dehydrogenase